MSKYNARSVEIDGHRFASVAEGRRYATLAALERAGKIAGLELQPRFDCVVAGVKVCSYIADFRYRQDGLAVVEDVKGVRTALYRLKRKLAEACHPGLAITEIPAAGAAPARKPNFQTPGYSTREQRLGGWSGVVRRGHRRLRLRRVGDIHA